MSNQYNVNWIPPGPRLNQINGAKNEEVESCQTICRQFLSIIWFWPVSFKSTGSTQQIFELWTKCHWWTIIIEIVKLALSRLMSVNSHVKSIKLNWVVAFLCYFIQNIIIFQYFFLYVKIVIDFVYIRDQSH